MLCWTSLSLSKVLMRRLKVQHSIGFSDHEMAEFRILRRGSRAKRRIITQDNQLIRPSQHGFIKSRTCLTNLRYFYEQIAHLKDEGMVVDVVYLDTSGHKWCFPELSTGASSV